MKTILKFFYKSIKTIVIIIIIALILLVILITLLSLKPFVPDNYTISVKTGGAIETEYLANGSFNVSFTEYTAPDDWEKYKIWYPAEIANTDDKYPLVIVANGTGVKASKYKALFRHLASWGFIVAGNEDPSTFSGDSADATLKLLLTENENPDSIFYHKIDTEHIGITGHSQGGVAVFNEIKNNELSNMYTCAISLSPTQED